MPRGHTRALHNQHMHMALLMSYDPCGSSASLFALRTVQRCHHVLLDPHRHPQRRAPYGSRHARHVAGKGAYQPCMDGGGGTWAGWTDQMMSGLEAVLTVLV